MFIWAKSNIGKIQQRQNETGYIQGGGDIAVKGKGYGGNYSFFNLNFCSFCFIFLMFKIILNCPFDFSWPMNYVEVCYLVFRYWRIFHRNSLFQLWCPMDTNLHYQAQNVSAKHFLSSHKLFFFFPITERRSDVSPPSCLPEKTCVNV